MRHALCLFLLYRSDSHRQPWLIHSPRRPRYASMQNDPLHQIDEWRRQQRDIPNAARRTL